MNNLRNPDKTSPTSPIINIHKRDSSIGSQFKNISLSMNQKNQDNMNSDQELNNEELRKADNQNDSNDSDDSSKHSHQNQSKSSSEDIHRNDYTDNDDKVENNEIRSRPEPEQSVHASETGGPVFYDDSKPNRRFRRRHNQIVRKYSCSFPGCNKSYGSLNHLNTHIVTKKHGQRKSKSDFHHDDLNSVEYNNGNYWYGYLPNIGIRYPYMQYPYQVPRNLTGQPQSGPHSTPQAPPQIGQFPLQAYQNLPPGTSAAHFIPQAAGNLPSGTAIPHNMAPFQLHPQFPQNLQLQQPQHSQQPPQHQLLQNSQPPPSQPQSQHQLPIGNQANQVNAGLPVSQVPPHISQIPGMQSLTYHIANQAHHVQLSQQSPNVTASSPHYAHLYQQGEPSLAPSILPPAQSSLQHLSQSQNPEPRATFASNQGSNPVAMQSGSNQGPVQTGTPVNSYGSLVPQSTPVVVPVPSAPNSVHQQDNLSSLQNSPAQTNRQTNMLLPPIQPHQGPTQQPHTAQTRTSHHQPNRINLPSIDKLTEDKS